MRNVANKLRLGWCSFFIFFFGFVGGPIVNEKQTAFVRPRRSILSVFLYFECVAVLTASTAFWLREKSGMIGYFDAPFRFVSGRCACFGSAEGLEHGWVTVRSMARARQAYPVGIVSKVHSKRGMKSLEIDFQAHKSDIHGIFH